LFPSGLPLFEAQSVGGNAGAAGAGGDGFLAVIVLGPPGSGKGTQAALLSEQLRLPHISTGAILRDRIRVGDAFGKAVAARIDVGQFVPDEWINRILDERVSMADCRAGMILDGYPRTVAQAERLLGRAETAGRRMLVVRLEAQAEMLVRRFAGRRQCSQCGALFHLQFQPSLAGGDCDRPGCAGVLVDRLDDRPEYVAGRLADFERLTAPVMELLEREAAGMVRVDAGAGNPEEVLERIRQGLEVLVEGSDPEGRAGARVATRWAEGEAVVSSGDRD
jgi:adenylate kinase